MTNRIWQESYADGIPVEIDMSDCSSISKVFGEAVAEFGDKTAFRSFGAELTYSEVDRLSRDFAAYLERPVCPDSINDKAINFQALSSRQLNLSKYIGILFKIQT